MTDSGLAVFARAWKIFGGVRNIFDSRYADPVSVSHSQDCLTPP
jgi:hypothetical protein